MSRYSKLDIEEMRLALQSKTKNKVEIYKNRCYFIQNNIALLFKDLNHINNNLPVLLDLDVFNEIVKADLSISIISNKYTTHLVRLTNKEQKSIDILEIIFPNFNKIAKENNTIKYSLWFNNHNRYDYRKENIGGLIPQTFLIDSTVIKNNNKTNPYRINFKIKAFDSISPIVFIGKDCNELIAKADKFKADNFYKYLVKLN